MNLETLLQEYPETARSLSLKWGVSEETFHKRRRAGTLEAVKIGNQWRFRENAGDSLVEFSPARRRVAAT